MAMVGGPQVNPHHRIPVMTDLREGLRLYEEGTGFGSFGAILAAAARAAAADAVRR